MLTQTVQLKCFFFEGSGQNFAPIYVSQLLEEHILLSLLLGVADQTHSFDHFFHLSIKQSSDLS